LPGETEGRRSAIGRSDSLAPSLPDVARIAQGGKRNPQFFGCRNEALRGALEVQKNLNQMKLS
jgi:hypothetical protein